MGCEEKGRSSYFTNFTVVKKSKGKLFAEKPVFCDEGNSLIICFDCSLHLYNTSTGDHVKELFQCSDLIISYHLHPLEPSKVIAVTENGEVIIYNLKTNEIEDSVRLTLNQKFLVKQKTPRFDSVKKEVENFDWFTQPLDSLAHRKFIYAKVKAFQNNPEELFVWTSWCLNEEPESHVSVFSLKRGKHIRLFHIQRSGLRKCNFNFVLNTIQGFEVFVGMSKYYVHVARYDVEKRPFSLKHYIGLGKEITCLAFHPTECSFATGDSLGRIIIWRNIFGNNLLKQTLHWHALQVHCMCFSKYGNYLFSGGEENVLVKWSMNSYKKDFLPRLSSTIHHISDAPEESLLSVSTADNKILIIDFNFYKISTVQHFSSWSVSNIGKEAKIFTIDPRSDCLVLSGRTGHIQFISLKENGQFLYTFDITNKTLVSDGDFEIENTEVTHARFSKDGKWMITAESRGRDVCKESRLKFWLYSNKQNSFKLNTNVEFPHDEFEIHSLEISLDDLVATTGGDKKFRLWSVFELEEKVAKKAVWAVFSVSKYRDFPCHAIDFSKDASLVAVTFGPALTVWETESCALKCSLSVPGRKDMLKFCKFGNHELSHLVVTGSKRNVSCWNLITLSVVWTVPIKLSLLISDPFSVFMGAFSHENSLIIFNPSSPSPDFVLNKVVNSQVIAAHCVMSENQKFSLYFLTADQQLFCFEDAQKISENTSSDTTHSFLTPYSRQLAEKQNRVEFDKRKTILLNKNNKQSVSCLLNSPAHALPNPSLLCLDVLKGLIVFSENQPIAECHKKEVKENYIEKTDKILKKSADIDSVEVEKKLSSIVKAIFV